LPRLSSLRYTNTVRDVLLLALGDPKLAEAAAAEVAPALRAMPEDQRPRKSTDEPGTFRRLDQVVGQGYVEGSYEVARAAAAALTKPERLARLVSCASGAKDVPACVDGFIRTFGKRVLRAPLTETQVARFQKAYGDRSRIDPAGFADVLTLMLGAPQFLYLVEHGDREIPERPGSLRLSAFELAARLSYHLWDTMPDDALFAAAESGALLTDEGYRREVTRLLADPRARKAMDVFYAEWTFLDLLPRLDWLAGDKAFQRLARDNLPSPGLRASVTEDALDLFRHLTWSTAGTFDELLTSRLAFPRTTELARLYGMSAAWDGKSAPPMLPGDARPGFLTRVGYLATGEHKTHPVVRGATLRRYVLCDDLPPPPADAVAAANRELEKVPVTASTRERAVLSTERAAPTCAACHSRINPLGYALEAFDTLGRLRTEELIIDEKTGELIKAVPIDTRAVLYVTPEDTTPAAGPADLVARIQASGKAHACFARGLVRYGLARPDDVEEDQCLVDTLTALLRQGTPLRDVMRALVTSPAFRERSLPL
jgi:hypothetical protein